MSDAPGDTPPPLFPPPTSPTGQTGRRQLPRLLDLVRVVALLVVVATVLSGVALLAGWRPSLNPFQDEEVNRSGPSVLQSLTDLSEYHAASAHYETVVDLEDDTRFLPGLVSGERVLYVGKGDVDAIVDFGELDERRIQLSDDGTSVTITLPAPTTDRAELDLENSYVAFRSEGLINRFKGSDLEREAQLEAVDQINSAAANEGTLTELAKTNTTSMLRGLFGALGYTDITVEFDEDPR